MTPLMTAELFKLFAATIYLITVHGPDGQEITLNVTEISSIRQVRKTQRDQEHIDKDINCQLFMANGKFIGITETCMDVIKKIAKLENHLEEEKK